MSTDPDQAGLSAGERILTPIFDAPPENGLPCLGDFCAAIHDGRGTIIQQLLR